MFDPLDIRLGAETRRRIEAGGLAPENIRCMPAAAGGPKGLALLPFDRLFAREWLPRVRPMELVVLIAPSRAMLDRLPNRKLPDRSDFYRYGLDHAARIGAWERAIAESERFAEAALAWLNRPDLKVVRPL